MRLLIAFAALLLLPISAFGYCFQEAGARYGIDPTLLQAIAIKESRLNKTAKNQNIDKSGKVVSTDYGVMQINSVNANSLVSMGKIRRPEDLLVDACFNVLAGAWVLAKHLRVCGNTWRCLGSYNAGFSASETQERKRLRYAADVRRIYDRLKVQASKPAGLAIR